MHKRRNLLRETYRCATRLEKALNDAQLEQHNLPTRIFLILVMLLHHTRVFHSQFLRLARCQRLSRIAQFIVSFLSKSVKNFIRSFKVTSHHFRKVVLASVAIADKLIVHQLLVTRRLCFQVEAVTG